MKNHLILAAMFLTIVICTSQFAPARAETNGLTLTKDKIVKAVSGNVYFIYPDHDRMHVKPPGVSWAELSDWSATGVLYGMCTNMPQNTVLDTCTSSIDQSSGAPILSGKTIVITGGPIVHCCVHYYESQHIAPVYWGQEGSTYCWYTSAGVKIQETELSASAFDGGDSYHQDMFVIETFQDSRENTVFVIYGYGWKGTFAGTRFFKFIVYPSIDVYAHAWYVFHWTDDNEDGFPDLDEVSQITFGD